MRLLLTCEKLDRMGVSHNIKCNVKHYILKIADHQAAAAAALEKSEVEEVKYRNIAEARDSAAAAAAATAAEEEEAKWRHNWAMLQQHQQKQYHGNITIVVANLCVFSLCSICYRACAGPIVCYHWFAGSNNNWYDHLWSRSVMHYHASNVHWS